mmetsp:Transcript_14656/g.25756  ORF Transcript_14656/g.25756 Transcript_14656/m.25756 type:complete len:210 (+) Transcript_14656:2301-2930(+)
MCCTSNNSDLPPCLFQKRLYLFNSSLYRIFFTFSICQLVFNSFGLHLDILKSRSMFFCRGFRFETNLSCLNKIIVCFLQYYLRVGQLLLQSIQTNTKIFPCLLCSFKVLVHLFQRKFLLRPFFKLLLSQHFLNRIKHWGLANILNGLFRFFRSRKRTTCRLLLVLLHNMTVIVFIILILSPVAQFVGYFIHVFIHVSFKLFSNPTKKQL